MTDPRPFTLHVPDAQIADLRQRLARTRFPDEPPLEPWSTGTSLAYLYSHAENPLFQCRFRWTENAIAFWDNRCTQHRAMWDYWPHTRSGTRVTVKGERPV